ncbi:MAG TPA: hypothetical protein VFE53_05520 [Mucilaginibacter sp.]|jgi:Tol biopolymer transport system component|nr:hypothetical protein [Mucilaginibacter sp.]
MQLISWLTREICYGIVITWCSFFSLFGQSAPTAAIIDNNARPQVFLQDGIASPNDESTPSFTADGKTLYLCDSSKICVSQWANGKWTTPKTVSFSGKFTDWDPFLSPDGKRLIFVSSRPVPGAPVGQKNNHLWYVDLQANGNWSEAHHLDEPVNVNGVVAYAPCLTRNGTVSFCSRNRDGHKGMGGYWAKWQGGHYEKPIQLKLNGDSAIFDPYISPDESYLIFASGGDLYISYRKGDDWTQGQKLGPQVNDGGPNGSPYVSPDGKMLYYSSYKVNAIMMIPIHIPTQIN